MAWKHPGRLTSTAELEEGCDIALDFERFRSASGHGVLPVVVQDVDSRDVLVLAHANKAALEYTLREGVAAFWSLSRDSLWVKGETSGNLLDVVEVRVNCEQNSLLYLVRLRKGGVCHTLEDGAARHSCYYRRINGDRWNPWRAGNTHPASPANCRVTQERPLPASEQHVTANGVSLWTATQGLGPPAVLCHGGPGIYDYLEPVAAMIDDLATIHRYDQRGCGRSQDTPPNDIATFVADLDALRAHWGYGSWTVIGHSWGAELALMYAIRHPDRVSRLAYLSGTGIDPAWHAQYRRNREAKLSPIDRERLRRLDERRESASATELARINSERAALLARTDYYDAAHVREMPRYDRFPINFALNAALSAEENRLEETGELRAQVAEVTVPTLVLDGEADPRPRWARAQIAELLPNGRHVTIARAGHEPWIEQPGATRQALREFLSARG